jgi:EAL domain-containing protein (putative c-di-GMP-specific phosphodiesterase class I)
MVDSPGPGLDSAGIVAWVQPIVALTTGTVVGYEALARFADRTTPVSDLFERAWALGEGPAMEANALRAALALSGRPAGAYLAVNVSPRAFESQLVREALDRDLAGFMVEVTEAHYVPTVQLKEIAAWLRERGARLAIDDVGTGYADLERLIVLRPDLIKLDRSLTMQLPVDAVTRLMVESLVQFAARSGAAVCAEGIEDAAQLEVVAELDITYGQGFLFGTPRAAWSSVSNEARAAAAIVHRRALHGTPGHTLLLDDFVLLERLSDRFSEAEDLEDARHAVTALTQLVVADDVAIDLVDSNGQNVERLSHHTWTSGSTQSLDDVPQLRWSLDTRRAVQVLITEPTADGILMEQLWAAGFGGLLVVPVITRGASMGVLSFFRHQPHPWTLNQIRLARIGASQLAATLDRLLALDDPRANGKR